MTPVKSWSRPQILEDGFPAFSARAVSAMQSLLKKNKGAKVLLTTSHKGKYTPDQWLRIFSARGLNIEHLETLEVNTANLTRKDEILRWLNRYQPKPDESIIIIDDDKSLFDLPATLKKHLVTTSPMIGLTEELIP